MWGTVFRLHLSFRACDSRRGNPSPKKELRIASCALRTLKRIRAKSSLDVASLLAKTGERGLYTKCYQRLKILWGALPHIRRGFAAPPSPKGEGSFGGDCRTGCKAARTMTVKTRYQEKMKELSLCHIQYCPLRHDSTVPRNSRYRRAHLINNLFVKEFLELLVVYES